MYFMTWVDGPCGGLMDHHLVRSSQIGTGQLAGGRWHVLGGLGEEGVFATLLRAAGCSITFRVITRLPALSSKLRDRRIVSPAS